MSTSLVSGSIGSGQLHLWKELRAARQAAQDTASTGTSTASTAAAASSTTTGTSSLSDASSRLVDGLNAFLLTLQQDGSATAAASPSPTAGVGTTGALTTTSTPAGSARSADPLQNAADQLAANLSSVIGSYTAQAAGASPSNLAIAA